MITVDVRDEVSGAVGNLRNAMHGVNRAVGEAEVQLFTDHFSGLPINRHNWPSRGYWADAAKSMHWTDYGDGVTVHSELPGLNMHATGIPETIEPKTAKMLTIPAVAAAYGRRAREFSNLRIAMRIIGGQLVPFALVEKQAPGMRGSKVAHPIKVKDIHGKVHAVKVTTAISVMGGGKKYKRTTQMAQMGEVIFWLKDQVRTHPYPGLLPTEEEMRETAVNAIEDAVALARTRSA
jgi:hypothetical protein